MELFEAINQRKTIRDFIGLIYNKEIAVCGGNTNGRLWIKGQGGFDHRGK